jgi:hypothetical protein
MKPQKIIADNEKKGELKLSISTHISQENPKKTQKGQ